MKVSSDKGTALVELAIILPLLMLIVFGICEFGLAMYVNNTLGNAAREGARVAAVTPAITASDARIAGRVTQCLTFNYDPAKDLSITNTVPGATGDPVTVTVTLTYHTFTNFFPMLDGKQFQGVATMRYEL